MELNKKELLRLFNDAVKKKEEFEKKFNELTAAREEVRNLYQQAVGKMDLLQNLISHLNTEEESQQNEDKKEVSKIKN